MTASTPITTPFTAESTAAEVVDGIDLTGRRAIVTGGASGIGIETARALAGAGAEVTLAVRNVKAGERTADDITGTTGSKQVSSPGWTWPTRPPWPRSRRPGMARWTCSSTTRGSWPLP